MSHQYVEIFYINHKVESCTYKLVFVYDFDRSLHISNYQFVTHNKRNSRVPSFGVFYINDLPE